MWKMEDSEQKVCKEIKSVIFILKNTLLFFVRTFRNKLKILYYYSYSTIISMYSYFSVY